MIGVQSVRETIVLLPQLALPCPHRLFRTIRVRKTYMLPQPLYVLRVSSDTTSPGDSVSKASIPQSVSIPLWQGNPTDNKRLKPTSTPTRRVSLPERVQRRMLRGLSASRPSCPHEVAAKESEKQSESHSEGQLRVRPAFPPNHSPRLSGMRI